MKKFYRISKKQEDTKKIAKDFLRLILNIKNKNAKVVGLYGDLGAGKTTFTKTVGNLLSIKNKINSPTFVIIKKYKIKHNKYKNFFHLDAFRLKNEKELKKLGWHEIISNPENLVFIEWPEKVKKIIPKKHYKIHIKHIKKGEREFKILFYK